MSNQMDDKNKMECPDDKDKMECLDDKDKMECPKKQKTKTPRLNCLRYVYKKEGSMKNQNRRRITIAYMLREETPVATSSDDKEAKNKPLFTGKVEYGASIFRPNNMRDKFDKEAHQKTAKTRLCRAPVVNTYTWRSLSDLECQMRKRMHTDGVRNRASLTADELSVEM